MFSSVKDLTKFFRALTSASRLRIVEQLASARGELSVGELADRLSMSQPLVSWHLRDLQRIDLVQMRRAGRQAFCSLNRERLAFYQQQFAGLLNMTPEGRRQMANSFHRPPSAIRRLSSTKAK